MNIFCKSKRRSLGEYSRLDEEAEHVAPPMPLSPKDSSLTLLSKIGRSKNRYKHLTRVDGSDAFVMT